VIPSLFTVLLEAVVRALIAGAAVWAGLRLFRMRNPVAEKAAWGLVLAAAVAMPVLMRWQGGPGWASIKIAAPAWARMPHEIRPQARADAALTQPVAAQETAAQTVDELKIEQESERESRFADTATPLPDSRALPYTEPERLPSTAPAAAVAANKPEAAHGLSWILRICWVVYFGICGLLLGRLAWGLISSLRLWMEATPVDAGTRENFPAATGVCWSERVSSPVNIGSGILLPADYAEWDEEKLRVVLAHEQSHVKQRDYYLQILAGLYAAMTWFSPLGWWLKHKLSELSEAISDRAGLDAATSPSAYAGLLLEFAALPRPTVNGVAMAHSKNLTQRIERLLNDASFRRGFAGGRRALPALVLPVVLIAATALVRVQAAVVPQQASSAQPATTGQANPQPAQVNDATPAQAPEPEAAPAPAAPAAAPEAVPSPDASPEAAPAPPAAPAPGDGPQGPPAVAPMAPMPPMPRAPHVHVEVHVPHGPEMARVHGFAFNQDFDFSGFGDGEPYAIVGDPGSAPRFFGEWDVDRNAEVEKARQIAHGHFLLFRRDGKSYVIDDPAIVNQAEEMDKARQDMSAQMKALGKQMRDAGQQARDEAQKARDEARKARETAANIPTPDISKEIAALDASAASLKEKQGGTVSREQLQEMQRQVMELQRRIMQAEFKINFNFNTNENWKMFSEAQGKFGAQMGELGAKMGQTMRENHQKMTSIIDESLKNGKARPVQ